MFIFLSLLNDLCVMAAPAHCITISLFLIYPINVNLLVLPGKSHNFEITKVIIILYTESDHISISYKNTNLHLLLFVLIVDICTKAFLYIHIQFFSLFMSIPGLFFICLSIVSFLCFLGVLAVSFRSVFICDVLYMFFCILLVCSCPFLGFFGLKLQFSWHF